MRTLTSSRWLWMAVWAVVGGVLGGLGGMVWSKPAVLIPIGVVIGLAVAQATWRSP